MGKLYNNWVEKHKNADGGKRLGVLIASGLIVGESLWGVFNAGMIYAADKGVLHVADPQNPIGLPFFNNIGNWGVILAVVAFLAAPIGLYRWIGNKAKAL
jgi:hypothetical protein